MERFSRKRIPVSRISEGLGPERGKHRAAAAVILVAIASFSSLPSAPADIKQDEVRQLISIGDPEEARCKQTTARTAHGNYDKGFTRAIVELHKAFAPRAQCLVNKVYKAAQRMGTRYDWFTRRNGSWFICWNTDWVYNPQRTWSWSVYTDWRTRACGRGVYRTRAFGAVKVQGTWYSDGVENSGHRF